MKVMNHIFYRLLMFSQACVKNSVQSGGVSASVHAGIHPPGQTPPSLADTPREDTPPFGTHPTEMHSCFP